MNFENLYVNNNVENYNKEIFHQYKKLMKI